MANMSARPFLVLEGVDLSGKTTIAALLAQELGAKLMKSPPFPFETIKQSVLECAAPLARFCYFIASNTQISKMASDVLANQPVVCDRYIWSTIAYHSAIENIPPQGLVNIVEPLIGSLRMPNLVVFLRVSRQAQLVRAKNKVDDQLQRNLLVSERFQQELNEAYEKTKELIQAPCIEVDTSESSISESVQEIIAEIKKKFNQSPFSEK